jgi:hypothetical protein
MKNHHKIILGLSLLLACNLALVGAVLWLKSAETNRFRLYAFTVELDKLFLECRRQEKNFLIRQDMNTINTYNDSYDIICKYIDDAPRSILDQESVDLLDELKIELDKYNSAFRIMAINMRNTYRNDEFIAAMHCCTAEAERCHLLIEQLTTNADMRYQSMRRSAQGVLIALILADLLITVLLSVGLVRRIRPVGQADSVPSG